MSAPSSRQDFDEYARIKPQQGAVPESWLAPFTNVVLPRLRAGARALDYGFGDGRFFDVLRSRFDPDHVHGVEVSALRAERARARGWSNVQVIRSGGRLPYEDASFDFVNMVEVIEHIPAEIVDACLAELARVMKPDAALLLTTPNYPIKRLYDLLDAVRLGRWRRLRDDPTHVSFYNHRRLQRRLAGHFGETRFFVYKAGLFYRRTGRPSLCHKMLAICTNPIGSA